MGLGVVGGGEGAGESVKEMGRTGGTGEALGAISAAMLSAAEERDGAEAALTVRETRTEVSKGGLVVAVGRGEGVRPLPRRTGTGDWGALITGLAHPVPYPEVKPPEAVAVLPSLSVCNCALALRGEV